MSETTNEDRMYPIEMTLQGARCCISIGKGVIKALGKPSHVSIKISDSHDSLSIFPCDEDDVMAFRVPLKLFTDHRCVMRINSKEFTSGSEQMEVLKSHLCKQRNIKLVKLPFKTTETEAEYSDRVKAVFKSVHIFIYSDTEADVSVIRERFDEWRKRL